MLKKSISVLLAILMIASVGVASAFALSDGTYAPSLAGPPGMPHALDILDGDADATTVTIDGVTYNKVTIALKPMEVVNSEGQTVTGTVTAVASLTANYTASLVGGDLVVTCPVGTTLADFSAYITFIIQRSDNVTHNMPATLTLAAIPAI